MRVLATENDDQFNAKDLTPEMAFKIMMSKLISQENRPCDQSLKNYVDFLTSFFEKKDISINPESAYGYEGMITKGPIQFFSIHERDVLPFFGDVWIGYIPDRQIIPDGKLQEIINYHSHSLQNQQKITTQIATTIQSISPKFVGIVIDGYHIFKPNCINQTRSATRTMHFEGSGVYGHLQERETFLKSIKFSNQ